MWFGLLYCFQAWLNLLSGSGEELFWIFNLIILWIICCLRVLIIVQFAKCWTLSTISLPKMSWPGIACRVVWYVDLTGSTNAMVQGCLPKARVIQVIVRFVLKSWKLLIKFPSQYLVCMLDDCIHLQILCQDHFSFNSVIIDTHIMEILPNELSTTVKGYKIRTWIMCDPFLLNNVSDCYWLLINMLFNLKPAGCRIDHGDTAVCAKLEIGGIN
jgi:hypothetical protein